MKWISPEPNCGSFGKFGPLRPEIYASALGGSVAVHPAGGNPGLEMLCVMGWHGNCGIQLSSYWSRAALLVMRGLSPGEGERVAERERHGTCENAADRGYLSHHPCPVTTCYRWLSETTSSACGVLEGIYYFRPVPLFPSFFFSASASSLTASLPGSAICTSPLICCARAKCFSCLVAVVSSRNQNNRVQTQVLSFTWTPENLFFQTLPSALPSRPPLLPLSPAEPRQFPNSHWNWMLYNKGSSSTWCL